MRAALSGALFVAVLGGLGLIAFLLLRGDGESPETRAVLAMPPQEIVDRARVEMAGLRSYRTAFTVPAHPEDARNDVGWDIEFEVPDSYRQLLFVVAGGTDELCESYAIPGGAGQMCREVYRTITGRAVSETLQVGDQWFGRVCQEIDTNCVPWLERPRPDFPVLGPTPSYLPQWPLVALELAQNFELVGVEERGGERLIRLRGSVNHFRAIFENMRRLMAEAGITSFGEECTARPVPRVADETGEPVESPRDAPAEGEETCRELTFEESLERQPHLSFYDEQPATIDVWVSPGEFFVRRVEIMADAPPNEPFSEAVAITIEYSLFNEIAIEAPR